MWERGLLEEPLFGLDAIDVLRTVLLSQRLHEVVHDDCGVSVASRNGLLGELLQPRRVKDVEPRQLRVEDEIDDGQDQGEDEERAHRGGSGGGSGPRVEEEEVEEEENWKRGKTLCLQKPGISMCREGSRNWQGQGGVGAGTWSFRMWADKGRAVDPRTIVNECGGRWWLQLRDLEGIGQGEMRSPRIPKTRKLHPALSPSELRGNSGYPVPTRDRRLKTLGHKRLSTLTGYGVSHRLPCTNDYSIT